MDNEAQGISALSAPSAVEFTAEGAEHTEKSVARLLGDRLLVRRDAPTAVSAGGVLLPRIAQRTAMRGTVLALGTGRDRRDGRYRPYGVAVGERVLFSWNISQGWDGGAQGRGEVDWPGLGRVLVLREADIFAVDESGEGAEMANIISPRGAARLAGEHGRLLRNAELEA